MRSDCAFCLASLTTRILYNSKSLVFRLWLIHINPIPSSNIEAKRAIIAVLCRYFSFLFLLFLFLLSSSQLSLYHVHHYFRLITNFTHSIFYRWEDQIVCFLLTVWAFDTFFNCLILTSACCNDLIIQSNSIEIFLDLFKIELAIIIYSNFPLSVLFQIIFAFSTI